jgi:hypothetical protein
VDFDSHADLVVAAAVALVNTATPGLRRGRAYQPPAGAALRDAVGEAIAAGRTVDAPMSGGRVPAFVALATDIRPVFEHLSAGDIDRAAVLVNNLLETYQPAPYLEHHDGQPWHLHYHGHPHADPSGWGGGMCVGLATVIGGRFADRLGVCQATACDRVYVDTSKNGTRRFCSTACQNRVKAAAHRARGPQRASQPAR